MTLLDRGGRDGSGRRRGPTAEVAPAGRAGGTAGLHPRPGVAYLGMPVSPDAAKVALGDSQLRSNLGHATQTIRAKRQRAVDEMPDWQDLRMAAAAVKDQTLAHLDDYLVQFEAAATAAGATVHWAVDADEACRIGIEIAQRHQVSDVVKVKSMATQEIGLNEALEAVGLDVFETDLAELIVQLGEDSPSHILVPAIHKNRAEIREIFARTIPGVDPELTDDPRQLAMAARTHLRERFLRARVAVSGANFAVAETGTLSVVESEGNGRMCLTLPDTLITVMGIEKVVPTWGDLEVFLQLLPRSSTGERMNPYTSTWAGVTPGDGPQEFHLVLLDNGRTAVLADEVGREALHCIRCSACLNVCPVYERTGGHAYGSVYPGPIGAILSPQLTGVEDNASLPFASSLCGACYEVCPVAIDIPSILVHLRAEHVEAQERPTAEAVAFRGLATVMSHPRLWHLAQRGARLGRLIARGKPTLPTVFPPPISGWTRSRDLPTPPTRTFVQQWTEEHGK